MKKTLLKLSIIFSASISFNAISDSAMCGDQAPPLLSVADFDADGKVTAKDIISLKTVIKDDVYYALYDRNGDGVLNHADISLAARDMNSSSSQTDIDLANMYLRFQDLQNISGFDTIKSMGFEALGGPLAFHGQHWMTWKALFSVAGFSSADPMQVEGLNILSDGSDIPALFWGEAATPLFHDDMAESGLSKLDWPSLTGEWIYKRVQEFEDSPPDFFPDTDQDKWHKHAGLCITQTDEGNGPRWNIDQHLSKAECDAKPNLKKVYNFNIGRYVNLWGNIWMLHVWQYDLNPNGVFANTHPCIEPDAASENDINGDRVVPHFFQHHE